MRLSKLDVLRHHAIVNGSPHSQTWNKGALAGSADVVIEELCSRRIAWLKRRCKLSEWYVLKCDKLLDKRADAQ